MSLPISIKYLQSPPLIVFINTTLYQATLIGGGGGILKYPPQRKNFENTPPSKIWEKFLKNREKLKNLG